LRRSKTGDHGLATVEQGRSSHQVWIKPADLPCLKRISNFVAKETELPVENQEKFQLLCYKVGQEYGDHYDDCTPTPANLSAYEACLANRRKRGWGARVYTFFIYLNDVLEGGETCFPKLDLSFIPEQGSAILWGNRSEDGLSVHPYSLHAGAPVTKGEKWAINVWTREKPEKISEFYKWMS
jgi:prolyl 4-hydroxylase